MMSLWQQIQRRPSKASGQVTSVAHKIRRAGTDGFGAVFPTLENTLPVCVCIVLITSRLFTGTI